MRPSDTSTLDPRTRLLFIFILCLETFLTDSPAGLAFCLGMILVAGLVSHVTPLRLLRYSRKVLWILLFVLLPNLLNTDGSVLFQVGEVMVTEEGILQGIRESLRLLIVFWGAVVLSFSVTPDEILRALEHMAGGLRKGLGPSFMVLSITLHLAPSIVRLARQIRESMLSRGLAVDTGGISRLRHLASAAMPLFASAVRTSGYLALSMDARCYDPGRLRTSYVRLTFRMADWLVIASAFAPLLIAQSGR